MSVRVASRIEPSGDVLVASRRWIEGVRPSLANDFLACYLTGSVLTQGFDPKRSRVNLLVVARSLGLETLEAIAHAIPETKKPPHFDPLFLTSRQIEKSLDSFPIEWLEIQETHLLLEGHDVLGGLEVPRGYLRLQCEHELRGKFIQLRQAYLLHSRHPDRLEPVLKGAASSFAALFRTLLRLRGESPPADVPHLIERVSDLHGLNAEGLLGAYLVRHTERHYRGVELVAIHRKFLAELGRLVEAIDELRVP
ncbi:MAG TPA: hypothetical protein VGK93_12990 [Candidatus Eisenbacteria bacterium]|jgi:hypothetical protein